MATQTKTVVYVWLSGPSMGTEPIEVIVFDTAALARQCEIEHGGLVLTRIVRRKA